MTRAIGEVGPQTECDACWETAWLAEVEADPYADPELHFIWADDARTNGQHPCTNHK